MRKLMPMAIALLSLALAGAAGAKTVAVTITKNGYVPKAVSIAAGDAVQFANGDTLAHQIVFKTTTGVACVPSPLVLQSTQSGTCSFQTARSEERRVGKEEKDQSGRSRLKKKAVGRRRR